MEELFYESGELKIVESVSRDLDKTFREKPYAKLNSRFNFDSTDLENYEGYLIRNCEERNLWPLEIFLTRYSSKELAEAIDYITGYGDKSRFDPPRFISELRSDEYAYFAGLAAGDGGFSDSSRWTLVDGGKNDSEISHSRDFIEDMSMKIQRLFGIPQKSITILDRGNKIQLTVSNKWFCRFLRYFFKLPESYKKGKLRRPSLFSEDEELLGAYWRGLFDADGAVSSQSNRVTITSATDHFIDQCVSDLQYMGIETKNRRERNGVGRIRISGNYFEYFCEKIGSAHPRKKKHIFSKLKNGSRTLCYRGRRNHNFYLPYFDLGKISDLRVLGLGDEIRDYRERNNLYQKELGSELGISKNQVYAWENEIDFASVEKLDSIFESRETFLEKLNKEEVEFKVGLRGNSNSGVKLPVKVSQNIDNIASNLISSKDELRIQNKNSDTASKLEKLFDTTVIRDKYKYYLRNWTVIRFFKTFYRYEPKFQSYSQKQIEKLNRKLKI
ncbi:MAG: LAGLIDADG family homing endonuclease [Candidatus Nanohaloarchaea archaeon]